MEPTRARTARDAAAADARRRPSTQYAAQHPDYLEQARALRGRPGATSVPERTSPERTPPSRSTTATAERPHDLWADLVPPRPVEERRAVPQRTPQRTAVRSQPAATGRTAVRRLLGLAAFGVLTLLSLPLHILALFFVYVQEESPGDLGGSLALLVGLLAAVFVALLATGTITQLVGGFPGRWRARFVFAALSGVLALGVAYAAALTQHF